MTWKMLVTYLKEPRGGGGSAHHANSHRPQGGGEDDEDPLSASSLSGDSIEESRNGSPIRSGASRRGKLLSILDLVDKGKRVGGSIESLEVSLASSNSPPSSVRLSRSGSIRVCDSPLHRGSHLGSPAFRRRKMKTRSELNLPCGTLDSAASKEAVVTPRLKSPLRRSGLPVPTSSTSSAGSSPSNTLPHSKKSPPHQASPSTTESETVVLRNKRRNGNNRQQQQGIYSRNSLGKNSPSQSPRNSLYRDTLIVNQQSSATAKPTDSNAAKKRSPNAVKSVPDISTLPFGKPRPNQANELSAASHSDISQSPKLSRTINATKHPPSSASEVSPRPVPPPKPTELHHHHQSPSKKLQVSKSKIPTSPSKSSNDLSTAPPPPSIVATPKNAAKQTPISSSNPKSNSVKNGKKKSPASNNSTASPRPAKKLHKPGHIPSYLNKSTPSLHSNSSPSVVKNNVKNSSSLSSSSSHPNYSKPRPVSGDYAAPDRATSLKGQHAKKGHLIETLLGDSRPLAPTAKFRSDGEISICDATASPDVYNAAISSPRVSKRKLPSTKGVTKEDDDHIYESVEPLNNRGAAVAVPNRPPRVTVAKNSSVAAPVPSSSLSCSPSSSSARVKSGRGVGNTATAAAVTARNKNICRTSAQQERLSSEVQCWPWGGGSNNSAQRKTDEQGATSPTKIQSSQRQHQRNRPQIGLHHQGSNSNNDKLKSASLGADAGRGNSFFKNRSRSFTLFQRLGGLRRSFSRGINNTASKNNLSSTTRPAAQTHSGDQDHVFFRGFGGKKREDLIEPYAVCHGPLLAIPSCAPQPQAPPRRRRPKRLQQEQEEASEPQVEGAYPLRRSFSFTDAHFIAQAMYEGDRGLIEELYPDFPRSTPIYAVVDRTKKRNYRQRQSHPSSSINGWGKKNEGDKKNPGSSLKSGALPPCLTPIPGSSEGESTDNKSVEIRELADPRRKHKVSSGSNRVSSNSRTVGDFEKNDSHSLSQGERRRSAPRQVEDHVTFSNSVMFVKQASDLQSRLDLPDLVHHQSPSNMSSTYDSPRRVTKVSLDSSSNNTPVNNPFSKFKEPSPVISPWNTHQNGRPGSTSSNESSSSASSCSNNNNAAHPNWPSDTVHPFAQRAEMHYTQRQQQQQSRPQLLHHHHHPNPDRSDVSITTSRHGGVTLSPHSELNINVFSARIGENNDRLGHSRFYQTPPSRYHRSESADRMHPENNGYSQREKKLSAPTYLPSSSSHHNPHHHHHARNNSARRATEDELNGNNSCSLDESFRKIIAKADNSINQAESILSSLRADNDAIPDERLRADPNSSESEPASLGSDIETNIRRLEKTQAKINAALETFRNVQAMEDKPAVVRGSRHRSNYRSRHHSVNPSDSSFCSLPPNVTPPTASSLGSLSQQQHNQIASKSKTAPGNLENGSNRQGESIKSSASNTPTHHQVSSGTRPKKTSLFRRHSFSLVGNKEKSPVSSVESAVPSSTSSQRESSVWYDGDVDSDLQASSSCVLYDDTHSFSDSEGGFMPLRNKLRGLLGSFGKGKKKLQRSSSKRRPGDQLKQGEITTGSLNDVKTAEHSNSPILKATLGEFTRQIESLSAKNEPDEELLPRQISNSSNGSSNYYTAHVTSVTNSSGNSLVRRTCSSPPDAGSSSMQMPKSVMLRQKRQLGKNDSNDTYSGYVVGSSSNGALSNRNSVISGQSMSSESYEHEDRSVSDDERPEGASNSSPRSANDDLTPEQRHEKKVYYIAREIMTSEKVFVDILQLLNVEFREFVQKARRESRSGIMPDTDFSRIFSNLPELQALNEDLLQDFEDRIENWDTLKKISDVIVKKGPFLKLYTTYIREFSAVNDHFDECCQKYPKFGKLVKEFEKKDRCRNLKLKHFMLKPVQRLPQYKLLLEDYLKHLDPESIDFDDTANALRIVSDAAEHANDTIKQGDQFRKMLKLQSRLGDTELIRPGRELLKEGELQKISRKGMGPRYFVLLSDCLLYCTYAGSWSGDTTSLRVTYRIPLTTLQVRVPNAEDYQNEFNITSPVRSCTLRASSVVERNDWLEVLNSAIEEHVSRKATFHAASDNGTQFLTPAEACKIGNSAPVWIPDRRVTMCQNCAIEFSVLVRRHHCRACGKVVCATCSGNKAPLRYRDFETARVCDECYSFLEKELSHAESLRSRFKKRDTSKNTRYVPQRLKVSANGDGAQMCGYLKKRLRNAKWKRMWFVLKDRVLYAYKASEDTVACETFPILGYELDTLSEKNFEIYEGEYAGLVFILSHPGGESLVFAAENDNVCEKWMAAIREATKLDQLT